MSMNIPNTSNIFTEIKTKLSKNKIVQSLKADIDAAIEFLSQQYSSDQSLEETNTKIKVMLTIGYQYMFKIISTLEIMVIKEENQSQKIIYEDALQYIIPMPVYTGSLHDIIKNANEYELAAYKTLSKIKSDACIEELYTKIHEKALEEARYVKTNCLNNQINISILCIVKAKEALEKL
jgi:hypothetical protein